MLNFDDPIVRDMARFDPRAQAVEFFAVSQVDEACRSMTRAT